MRKHRHQLKVRSSQRLSPNWLNAEFSDCESEVFRDPNFDFEPEEESQSSELISEDEEFVPTESNSDKRSKLVFGTTKYEDWNQEFDPPIPKFKLPTQVVDSRPVRVVKGLSFAEFSAGPLKKEPCDYNLERGFDTYQTRPFLAYRKAHMEMEAKCFSFLNRLKCHNIPKNKCNVYLKQLRFFAYNFDPWLGYNSKPGEFWAKPPKSNKVLNYFRDQIFISFRQLRKVKALLSSD
jgi:hypothetical protein